MRPLLSRLAKCVGLAVFLASGRGLYWLFNSLVLRPLTDPLRLLQGPGGAWNESHMGKAMDPQESPATHREWTKMYGSTFAVHGFGRHDRRLLTLDIRAISHVLHSPVYEKPWQTRLLLSRLLGRGVFAMEGEEHRVMRKSTMPAFTTNAIKALEGIFMTKAEEVRDVWNHRISDEPDASIADAGATHSPEQDLLSPHPPPGASSENFIVPSELQAPLSRKAHSIPPSTSQRTLRTPALEFASRSSKPNHPTSSVVVDVYRTLSLAVFDVMGLAGFDYPFNAVQMETTDTNCTSKPREEEDQMYSAYRTMFDMMDQDRGFRMFISLYLPWIDSLWPNEDTRTTRASLSTINIAGARLIANKKAAISAEMAQNNGQIVEKDILSLLTNTLSDSDILDQLSTFLFAGGDTTSTALAWCLHLLATHPAWQTRLRTALLASPAADPPLLDAVLREALRLAPPVHSTIRVATADDLIPLSHPVTLRDGSRAHAVRIRKGSFVHVPLEGLNYSAEIYGARAAEFDPARWLEPEGEKRLREHPGLAGVMSFTFGPHGCPGWRFAMVEMKAFLGVLLRAFVFGLAPEDGVEDAGEGKTKNIMKFNIILTRPYVEGERTKGAQLPLLVQRYIPHDTVNDDAFQASRVQHAS